MSYKGKGFYTKASKTHKSSGKVIKEDSDTYLETGQNEFFRLVPPEIQQLFADLEDQGGKGPELCEAITQRVWGSEYYVNIPQTFDGYNPTTHRFADVKYLASSKNTPFNSPSDFVFNWAEYAHLSTKQELLLTHHGTEGFSLIIYAWCKHPDNPQLPPFLYSIYVTTKDGSTTTSRGLSINDQATLSEKSTDYTLVNAALARKYNIEIPIKASDNDSGNKSHAKKRKRKN